MMDDLIRVFFLLINSLKLIDMKFFGNLRF